MAIGEEKNQSEQLYIKGELLHNIYRNEEEHFSIAKIKVADTNLDEKDSEIVVKGYLSRLEEGEPYLFYGTTVEHKKFGKQFHVTQYEKYIPSTEDGVVSYLSSDLFYGIGKKTAERIVEQLGTNAIKKILEDRTSLSLVKGLNKEKADRLFDDLKHHQGFEHIVVKLSQYGFTLKMAQKIYEVYKEEALEIFEKDPYQYVFDIEGFGFHRADEAAHRSGVAFDHPNRIKAGLIYMLQQSMSEGHVYQTLEKLLSDTEQLLNKEVDRITFEAISEQAIILHEEKRVIIENSNIYLPSLYMAETGVTKELERLFSKGIEEELPMTELMKLIGSLEEEESISYGKEQFEAIEKALSSKVMILTGGPGTGKTTVIKGIIQAYAHLHELSLDEKNYDQDEVYPFLLAAPTGRAAKRIKESTGLPAVTIHRLLGWSGNESFERDRNNPLAGKLLVIDEFSMVDIWLANQLLKAVPDDMQILIVGDEDQLPSVGPGQVLADLLASEAVPYVKLKEVYRQKEGSKIIQLAHQIKNNTCDLSSLTKEKDFNFISCSENQVVEVITQIVQKAAEKGMDLKDWQVLAPMYRSRAGIHRINEEIQSLINPKSEQKRELSTKDHTYRSGDKVIQLVNQPEDGVYNGDIGEISAIFEEDEGDNENEQVVVEFEDREVAYNRKDLNAIMHAYCTSIHKSQGSEFPIVILPVVPGYRRMLRKNLLYTAVTRCQKSLIICGDRQAFLQGIQEEDTNRRNTALATRLKKDEKKYLTPEEEDEQLSPYDFL